jgi:hypothetical protein
MRKTQTNFYSMYLALTHFYEKYKEQLESDAVIARLFTELFSYSEQMKQAIQTQNGHTSESAKQKQIEEDEMVEATTRAAARAYVYATERNIPGLQEKLSVSTWILKRLSDVKLHSHCLSVYEALSTIDPTVIAEYGITPANLTSLKKEIDDFYAYISQPRSDIITRSQATAKIDDMVKMQMSLLKNRLDKMIESLPDDKQEIKNEYRAARVIIDIPGRKPGSGSEQEQPVS